MELIDRAGTPFPAHDSIARLERIMYLFRVVPMCEPCFDESKLVTSFNSLIFHESDARRP